jgi:hypothetical protein
MHCNTPETEQLGGAPAIAGEGQSPFPWEGLRARAKPERRPKGPTRGVGEQSEAGAERACSGFAGGPGAQPPWKEDQ